MDNLKNRIKRDEIEIALHGNNHEDNNLYSKSFLLEHIASEFAGLDYLSQLSRIKKAKYSLDSLLNINVNIFIPPFNTYDDNTLKSLDSLNFRIISAGKTGSTLSSKISYIPYTIDDLTQVVNVIRENKNSNGLIVVMLHPYSIIGDSYNPYRISDSNRITFKKLELLLNWITSQSYVNVTSFSSQSQNDFFDKKRFEQNSFTSNLLSKVFYHSDLNRHGIYIKTETKKIYVWISNLLNIGFHLITFLVAFFTTKFIVRKKNPSTLIITTSLAIIFLLNCIFMFIQRDSDSFGILSFYLIISFFAVLFGAFTNKKVAILKIVHLKSKNN